MAVSVNREPTFNHETPKTLFRGNYVSAGFRIFSDIELHPWDISPDGKRFLMMKEVRPAASSIGGLLQINIVLNWLEELKQRAPRK